MRKTYLCVTILQIVNADKKMIQSVCTDNNTINRFIYRHPAYFGSFCVLSITMILIVVCLLFSALPITISKPEAYTFYHEYAKISYYDPNVMDAKGVFFKLNRTQGAMNVTVITANTYNTIPVSVHSSLVLSYNYAKH